MSKNKRTREERGEKQARKVLLGISVVLIVLAIVIMAVSMAG
ncbi:MAG: hypothetical protein ACOYJE_05125 [Bacteroidaceae bacterium]|jgi:hypothetical protein